MTPTGIEPEVAPRDEEETFDRTVDEGRQRLGRSWLQLIATGLLGGLDVGVGVLALLLVEHLTGNPLLSALAFATGFIALTWRAASCSRRTSWSRLPPWWPRRPPARRWSGCG